MLKVKTKLTLKIEELTGQFRSLFYFTVFESKHIQYATEFWSKTERSYDTTKNQRNNFTHNIEFMTYL